MSFAQRALLDDQNQLLTRMNNEAKVRRSTKVSRTWEGEGNEL
jgi:hypothetical protein